MKVAGTKSQNQQLNSTKGLKQLRESSQDYADSWPSKKEMRRKEIHSCESLSQYRQGVEGGVETGVQATRGSIKKCDWIWENVHGSHI